jgi:hypothetical protein
MMFAFSVCLLYCIEDVEAVTGSSLPLVEIFYSASVLQSPYPGC